MFHALNGLKLGTPLYGLRLCTADKDSHLLPEPGHVNIDHRGGIIYVRAEEQADIMAKLKRATVAANDS